MCQYLSAIAKSDVGGQYEAEASIPPDTTSVTDPKSVNYKITNSKTPTTQLAALRRRLVFLMPQTDADQKQGILFAQKFEHKPGKVPVALWDALYNKLVRRHSCGRLMGVEHFLTKVWSDFGQMLVRFWSKADVKLFCFWLLCFIILIRSRSSPICPSRSWWPMRWCALAT